MTSVFTAYVTPIGSCWVDDGARRAGAGVPDDVEFTTKPDLAAAQIHRQRVPIAAQLTLF